MYRLAGRLLRVAILVLLLGSVLAQVLVPLAAAEEGRLYPEVAHLVVPYSVAGILVIACVQVAMLALWPLLALVDRGAIFGPRGVRWVEVIAASATVATVLTAGVVIHLLFVEGVAGPLILWLPGIIVGGMAFVLLMVVVRGVLESGVAERRA